MIAGTGSGSGNEIGKEKSGRDRGSIKAGTSRSRSQRTAFLLRRAESLPPNSQICCPTHTGYSGDPDRPCINRRPRLPIKISSPFPLRAPADCVKSRVDRVQNGVEKKHLEAVKAASLCLPSSPFTDVGVCLLAISSVVIYGWTACWTGCSTSTYCL